MFTSSFSVLQQHALIKLSREFEPSSQEHFHTGGQYLRANPLQRGHCARSQCSGGRRCPHVGSARAAGVGCRHGECLYKIRCRHSKTGRFLTELQLSWPLWTNQKTWHPGPHACLRRVEAPPWLDDALCICSSPFAPCCFAAADLTSLS